MAWVPRWGDLVLMSLVKPLDREVHLLVSLEVGGELHAPSGRMVHERLIGR